MTADPDLRSAPIPGLAGDDHLRGPADGALVIVYTDFECPFCAALHARLRDAALRVCVRHFPVRSAHPRAWPAARAAEAAAAQGRFWEMHDALFADPARLEDPHLWARARRLGLDIDRFDADRRGAATEARVTHDFRAGVRGGVVTTPAAFAVTAEGSARALSADAVAGLGRR